MERKRNRKMIAVWIALLSCCAHGSFGQNDNDWKTDIQHLKMVASVLFIGVSPNDFDQKLADYFLRTKGYRVGLLSLTRGENTDIDSLAYSLEGVQRGIYHVNKAVARINKDYSDLYFTRAYDFLSNGKEDSAYIFEKCWDPKTIYGDLVWQIRTFRPDVILFPASRSLTRQGKRFYALQMIKDAIRVAADSSYFKEQFDASRYPWKAFRVLALDDPNGHGRLTMNDSLYVQYDLVEGDLPRVTVMDGIDTSWNRIYEGADNGQDIRYLDSIVPLHVSKKQGAQILLALKSRFDTSGFRNDFWKNYKENQLTTLLMKYAGIQVSIDFEQPLLVLGKPYRYTIRYAGDTSIFKLNSIQFGRFDTSFKQPPSNITITKRLTFSNKETPYQPYWMAAAMSTPGMYQLANQEDLNSPTNYNFFQGSFACRITGLQEKISVPAYYTKPKDSVPEMPVVTLPGFVNIAPAVVLPHLLPYKSTERIFVQLQSNFKEAQVPITINIYRKGLMLSNSSGFKSGHTRLNLATKDTIADLGNGGSLNWYFDIDHRVLDTLDGDLAAEIWLGKDNQKLKINSSLVHIYLPGLPDINYHYQPKIALLGKNTFVAYPKGTVGILVDSSMEPTVELTKMALTSLHIPYKTLYATNATSLDSLSQYHHVVLGTSVGWEKNFLLGQYVQKGGTLVVVPIRSDSLPLFVKDSTTLTRYNLVAQSTLAIETKDSCQLLSFPNKIIPNEYPSEGMVSTINWDIHNLKQNYELPVTYHNAKDTIVPLVQFQYGKGKVVLNGFAVDAAALENPFVYKLWANILDSTSVKPVAN
ncbi:MULTISPECIES: hypothetical protein [Chitinophagaceae]